MQRGQFGDGHRRAIQIHRRALAVAESFFRNGEEKFLSRQKVFHDRHCLLREKTRFIRDQRNSQRMQTTDVFHRPFRVRVIGGLVGVIETRPLAQGKAGHVFQRRIEIANGVFTLIAEAADVPSNMLERLGQRSGLMNQMHGEFKFLARLEIRIRPGEWREHSGLHKAVATAQCDAEFSVPVMRHFVSKLPGIRDHARGSVRLDQTTGNRTMVVRNQERRIR